MNILEFTLAVAAIAALAGFLGALTGLGGGVVITPALTLLLGVDIRYAIGATLVSVIATSSGAAAAYVREGFSNIRVGMFLEVATTTGAVLGAYIAMRTPSSALAVIFGGVLLASAWLTWRRPASTAEIKPPDPLACRLKLNGSYPTITGERRYNVRRVKTGFGLMFGAGTLGGLLGLGSGAMKVMAMDQAMRLPFKVSTTTSNFMIGVTAAASAGVYLRRGYIDPGLAMPVTLGVLAGATVGARFLAKAQPRLLRLVFAIVVAVLALRMIWAGVTGGLG
ncbi:MAG TPA: sulfite exporter TauE/SafE family protein [Bryobacteraceae bacterium]|nr:sulfite exporter TauE/SafE family protein [Bryobacteraceae bacterium]